MKTTMKRALSTLCLMCVLLSMSAASISCGDNTTAEDTTGGNADDTTETATEEVTTEQDIKSTLPTADFDGDEFNIFLWEYTQMAATEENGDIINDAVYRRNADIEELYNVKLSFTVRDGSSESGKASEWFKTITASILAGDGSIDLAGGYGYMLASNSLDGNYVNLCDVSPINFADPWWADKIMESSKIGNKLYMALGCADPQYWDCVYAMYCNKRLADQYSIPDLYALVNDGKWTLDKLMEFSELASADLNGDGVMDDTDQYGYLTGNNMEIDALIPACGIKIVDKDKDGLPELLGLTEKYIDVQKRMESYIKTDAILYGISWEMVKPFMNGQGLFMSERIEVSHTMREMKDDFSVLPYPKYDEKQEGYGTYLCIDNTTGFSIPVTADAEKSGYILNALSALGYSDVRPEYYDRVLKGKVARDDESTAMLDLIFSSVTDDFSHFYSYSFGNQGSPWMLMRMSLKENKDISSMWAKNENMYKKKMGELISALK